MHSDHEQLQQGAILNCASNSARSHANVCVWAGYESLLRGRTPEDPGNSSSPSVQAYHLCTTSVSVLTAEVGVRPPIILSLKSG